MLRNSQHRGRRISARKLTYRWAAERSAAIAFSGMTAAGAYASATPARKVQLVRLGPLPGDAPRLCRLRHLACDDSPADRSRYLLDLFEGMAGEGFALK